MSSIEHVRDIHRTLTKMSWELGEARKTLSTSQASVEHLESEVDLWAKAAALLHSISDAQTEQLQRDVEGLVTRGLRVVFDDQEMAFHVVVRVLRNQLGVEFFLKDRNGQQRPVIGAHGGGLVELVSFVLRVVIVRLTGRVPLLVLDEPFGMVSANYRANLAEFVKDITTKAGIQLVIVTHDDHIPAVADKVVRFELDDGKTKIVS